MEYNLWHIGLFLLVLPVVVPECNIYKYSSPKGCIYVVCYCIVFIYTSTLAQLCISFLEIDDNAANLSVLLFTMCLAFCGVLVTKEQLPGFWVFMYRCSPFTYLVSVMLSVGLVDAPVTCAAKEYLRFSPPQGYTCMQYMEPYMKVAGGYLLNENSTTECEFCTMKVTNVF